MEIVGIVLVRYPQDVKSELSVIIVCDSIIIRNSLYPPPLPFSLYNFVVTLYNNVMERELQRREKKMTK